MTFRADGTSVVRDTKDGTSGVALTFDPDMASRIAEALNKHMPDQGRAKVDPLTGNTVEKLDTADSRSLSEAIGKGRFVKIVGPYATATMDTPGGRQIRSLAEGSIVPGDVTAGHARHLIDVGLAEVVEAKSAKAAHAGEAPPERSKSTEKRTEPGAAPAGNASREEWAAHATSKGAPAEETRPVEEGGLKQTELRAKYGG